MVKIFEYYSALVDSFHQDDRDEYSKRPPILVIGSSYKDSRSRIKNLSFQTCPCCLKKNEQDGKEYATKDVKFLV